MKLDTVQFISIVNHYGQHLQGASNTNVGDRPGQPPFDIEVVEGGVMPCIKLEKGGRVTLVPMTNVASYRESPKPVVPAKVTK